jgi:hypothetical protein
MVLYCLLRTRYTFDHQSTVKKITSDEETILSLQGEYNKEKEKLNTLLSIHFVHKSHVLGGGGGGGIRKRLI